MDTDGLDNVLKGVVHSSDGQKRILIASRHARNDSRGIQLEMKYGSDGETVPVVAAAAAGKLPFKRSHIRSNSCDVKFMRDYDGPDTKYLKVPKKCHSRTSSRDMEQEFRNRFASHNRNNSDHLNIKCIINYLKSSGPKNGMLNEEGCGSGSGSGASSSRRGHSRNHSYDRIYTTGGGGASNNEGFQPDFLDHLQNQLHEQKDVNVRRAEMSGSNNGNTFMDIVAPAAIELLVPASFESKYTHSRNNSKDFNVKLDDFAVGLVGGTTAANLRHRRTNSKDLNVNVGGQRNSLSRDELQEVGDLVESSVHFNGNGGVGGGRE